jgi:His/Glu/Gln/Arg/opine family amino acid ABC transporter permease subunit
LIYQPDFTVVWSHLRFLAGGLVTTVLVSALAVALGLVIGMAAALGRTSRFTILRWVLGAYIEVFRGTPLLAQLYIIVFGLPSLGLRVTPLQGGIIGLSLYTGAYLAEILRGSISSVPQGQTAAALSLGLSQWQAFRKVILPQAFRNAVPATGNQVVDTTLSSSLLYVVGAPELTQHAASLSSEYFRPIEVYTAVGIAYLLITVGLTLAVNRLNVALGGRRSRVSVAEHLQSLLWSPAAKRRAS